jgi:hypothetical protein
MFTLTYKTGPTEELRLIANGVFEQVSVGLAITFPTNIPFPTTSL